MEKVDDFMKIKPHGGIIKTNLRLSQTAMDTFERIKRLKRCTFNAQVFDVICDIAFSKDKEELINGYAVKGPLKRKTYNINERTMNKLHQLSRKSGLSTDDIIEKTLLLIHDLIEVQMRQTAAKKKYRDKKTALKAVDTILSELAALEIGLESLFPKQTYVTDGPDNLPYLFSHIEGQLYVLQETVERLFNERISKSS